MWEETTKYTKYSKKCYAQHCQRGRKPRITRIYTNSTACEGRNHRIHRTHRKRTAREMCPRKTRSTRKARKGLHGGRETTGWQSHSSEWAEARGTGGAALLLTHALETRAYRHTPCVGGSRRVDKTTMRGNVCQKRGEGRVPVDRTSCPW